jgi:DNA replication protein DnaC
MSENEEVIIPSTDVAEVKEETPVAVEGKAAPEDEEEELIYTDPSPKPVLDIPRFWWSGGLQSQAIIHHQRLALRHLPDGARHYVTREIKWVYDDPTDKPYPWQVWTEALARPVGLGEIECPYCKGTLTVARHYKGLKTGIRTIMPEDCHCRALKRYYPRWHDPAIVPRDYRNLRMHNLEQYIENFRTFKASGQFQYLLDTVRENEHNCYLLVGPAGTGKSTLMVAMYHRALINWAQKSYDTDTPRPAVWKVNATALSKQFREWELRDVSTDDLGKPNLGPEVTVGKVMAAIRDKLTPCLFIDEFDKIKLNSEFQAKEFSAIIDAIQSNGGQVVASSNLTELGLKHALGDQYGPPIIRRLIGPRLNPDLPEQPTDPSKGGFLIDFKSGKVHHNYSIETVAPSGTIGDYTKSAASKEKPKSQGSQSQKTQDVFPTGSEDEPVAPPPRSRIPQSHGMPPYFKRAPPYQGG